MEIRVYTVPTADGGKVITTDLAKAEELSGLHGLGFTTEVHVVEKPGRQQLVQRVRPVRDCGC